MNLIFNHGKDRYMAEIDELYINARKMANIKLFKEGYTNLFEYIGVQTIKECKSKNAYIKVIKGLI